MKLDYNIIWVEDKIGSRPFKALIENVSDYLTENFFKVRIDTAEDYSEFKTKFGEFGDYDLIITDLNLNESHGTQVIDFIRDEKHILTEVFFYSANSELRNTTLINNNRISFYQLEGASYHRELGKRIEELIALTITKFQHIVTMRGMIMQETSSLDFKMESIVRDFIKDPKNESKINSIIDPMIENIRSFTKEKNDKALAGKIRIILKDNVLFNASQKIFALGQILKLLNENDFSDEYDEEVNLLRNQFAHAELLKTEDGSNYFKVKGNELKFDAELCRNIRRNIIKHEKNIVHLEEKVNSQ